MKEAEYQSDERLFILASELSNLNQTLIALTLGDNQRVQIMREYVNQRNGISNAVHQ